jgi:Glycosyl transferases group 1
MRHNTITTSALMVRGSLRERYHPIPDWARVQDWWISLCVAEVAEIGCLHEPVVDYRRHGSNLNHGRSGRRRAELLRAELPLRRRLLSGSAVERLSGEHAAAALTAFDRAVEGAADGLGTTRRALVSADRGAGDARLAAGRAADDPHAAARHFVAALAHDPWNALARTELAAAGRRGGWIAAPGSSRSNELRGGTVARPRIDGARAFVTLADADELAARPELLAAYATAFGAGDDATLVIRLGEDAETLERLEAVVAAAGLDGDDAADLLAVPAGGSPARLAAGADAVLSAALPAGPLAALPCVDAGGVAALAQLATGARAWCINICAPNWWSARSWGDLHFARAIQQELHRRGRPCAIHVMDQWESSRDERFGVVVHLKGLSEYEPNPAQFNVLWNISHPEKLTDRECEASDLVLVASEHFAAALRERVSTPVAVLEQATDPAVFFPEQDPAHARELVFVGNSRRVMRRVIADLLPTDRDLAVWGGDWDGLIDPEHVVGTYLPNDEVRRAYSSAAIVLNDHWDDMREHGFASNRLYDAVACGALVLSDRLAGVEERFGGAVVTYETRDELRTLVEHFLANPQERAARGAAGRELVLAGHTFAHRVETLLGLVRA